MSDEKTDDFGALFERALAAPAVQDLRRRVESGSALSCEGVAAAAQPFLAALLHRLFPRRPIVVVADSLRTQESFQQDLETWLSVESKVQSPKSKVGALPELSLARRSVPTPLFYPAWEILPHEDKLPHADVISERLETLVTLTGPVATGEAHAPRVVTSVVALLQRTFAPAALAARTRTLRRGDRVNPLDLIEWLEEQAYEPEAQVTSKGEIALRGGIVDVFPLTSPWPVRLEFFGDELESLRHFDPLTQVSREAGEVSEVILPPAGELGILKKGLGGTGSTPSQNVSTKRTTLTTKTSSAETIRAGVEAGPPTPKGLGTLLDYLPSETIFLLFEPEALAGHAEDSAAQVPEADPFFIGWKEFQEQLAARGMTAVAVAESEVSNPRSEMTEDETVSHWSSAKSKEPQSAIRNLQLSSLDAFRPLAERTPQPEVADAQRREFFAQLHRWLRQGHEVHVFCNNDGERQRFHEIWRELGPPQDREAEREGRAQDAATCPSPFVPLPSLYLGSLSRGFLFEEAKLVVVTDAEVFGRYKVQRPRRLKSPHAIAARSALDIDFTDLEEGDLVVHLQHGIGRFLGLKLLPVSTRTQDSRLGTQDSGQECLVIEYAPSQPDHEPPKLYVPVTESHLVSKYVGAGKARPPLHTLGGTRWAKTKQHAEQAVRDLASELLAIQAARETQSGHAFQPDVTWQREFESAFIYEETPDQMRAILEAKADMEKPKPMDRLICGDVGYGKTEVAIRAAFKAVMDGKQTAILVPTTILAQQHFNTLRERMADYPVRIELLSRFRSRREQNRVIRDLATGSVDIVIGTHRLVQDDVAFKELGLVVIDEEQRFGVLHKEKFKRLRRLVDVLTLSATPIPRTLYLALTGARDMSTIQTPPQDRLPIETTVCQYDERIIRDAIQRELNRGGQVYFLHNRVVTIDAMKFRLMQLLPDARIVVGHGQMDSDELEEVMTKFVNGEADVLLSTSIIEAGLDIPNANTIIIDRADRFGLSELYQLRGRVGRYKHQAYAYLLLPRHARLLTDVRKRMSAIRQYSSLGSGFKIAMRDLEIRGAGNLLGPQQSGHITAVGFELYCQLLKKSVATLKGEKVKPQVPVEVRLDFLEVGAPGGEGSDSATGLQYPAVRSTERATHNTGRGAFLPHTYIAESQQRIEIYRKLAQAEDKAALVRLEGELRDRFGPVPKPVELLLLLAEVKLLAGERSVSAVETQEDRLMLTRHGDFITLAGKFPRLTRKTAGARLKEIRSLLLAL